jgi:hypothetical protein
MSSEATGVILRQTLRQMAHDLQGLKLTNAHEDPRVGELLAGLRSDLLKGYWRFVKLARSRSAEARKSSARHTTDLLGMKTSSARAKERLRRAKIRLTHRP